MALKFRAPVKNQWATLKYKQTEKQRNFSDISASHSSSRTHMPKLTCTGDSWALSLARSLYLCLCVCVWLINIFCAFYRFFTCNLHFLFNVFSGSPLSDPLANTCHGNYSSSYCHRHFKFLFFEFKYTIIPLFAIFAIAKFSSFG